MTIDQLKADLARLAAQREYARALVGAITRDIDAMSQQIGRAVGVLEASESPATAPDVPATPPAEPLPAEAPPVEVPPLPEVEPDAPDEAATAYGSNGGAR